MTSESNDITEKKTSNAVRAAQYVRMSTDHQRYSTENQADVIAQYAARRGITIVHTYADEGKSGLSIDGRDALQSLIDDVQAGRTDFTTILVYDVSRWGRFQDADESAYYEHVCKRAGITVQYCAEQFENDGSLSATIIKSMKRAMAGEYSRELSVKVFSGQCRLIELGYRQGGPAGFGLRRMLQDERGVSKGELARGEHKSLQTDRVVLVPGPSEEVEAVLRIYRMFVHDGISEKDIANLLNADALLTDLNRPWTRGTVHQVLTNEKYIGNNVFNRVSFKLKKKRVCNESEMWIRRDGAFPAIVSIEMFMAARNIIAARSIRHTDTEMLEALSRLLADRGELSGLIIDEMDGMPSSSAYQSRFGSLLKAYQLVGYSPGRDYRYIDINRVLRRMHPEIVARAITAIQNLGGTVQCDPSTDLLTINAELTASIAIVRCQETSIGSLRWKIRFDASLRPDITVVIRMAPGNSDIFDYYLLPRVEMTQAHFKLKEDNGIFWDAYRFDTLDRFFQLTARTPIRSAA